MSRRELCIISQDLGDRDTGIAGLSRPGGACIRVPSFHHLTAAYSAMVTFRLLVVGAAVSVETHHFNARRVDDHLTAERLSVAAARTTHPLKVLDTAQGSGHVGAGPCQTRAV